MWFAPSLEPVSSAPLPICADNSFNNALQFDIWRHFNNKQTNKQTNKQAVQRVWQLPNLVAAKQWLPKTPRILLHGGAMRADGACCRDGEFGQ